MTKPITAAVAMILVEDGRIALKNEVAWFLPELSDRRSCARRKARSTTRCPLWGPSRWKDPRTLK